MIKIILFSFLCFQTAQLYAQEQPKAQLFPLAAVKLEDELFLKAQQNNLKYILALEPDRLLAPFLKEAKLTPKAPMYGNWETSGLGGQTAGHYLSSLAMMYASTKEPELIKRLNYMIDELAICQQKNPDGYLGGVPDGLAIWADVANGKIEVSNFSLNKKWVPWYNLHKLYAGLIDAYLIGNNQKAKQILVKLSDWCLNTIANLSDEQMQNMLRCEHGGMNEVLADVAAITGDDKYLAAAKRFSHQFILQPLVQQKDALTGLHANTQIPKVIGFMRIAELTDNQSWKNAAKFFWENVVYHRSVAIGGNSVREHFNKTDDFSELIHHKDGPETCNSYNMLKLSKQLFQDHPQAAYMDFYEKTTYNHILASQHPQHGGLVYLTPMRAQHYRVYSKPELAFWCCVGTGIENHAKYGELIYAHQKNDIYVNLFIASTLNWTEKGLILKQETKFPFQESTALTLKLAKPSSFTLYIRKPEWLKKAQMNILVNQKPVKAQLQPNGYYVIQRNWKNNDQVKLTLPMTTQAEKLPDQSSWVAFKYGPVVLAAATSSQDLVGLVADDSRKGHIANGPIYSVADAPVIITAAADFKPQLEVINKEKLIFGASSYIYQAKYKDLKLIPFFKLHDARYMLYWPVSNLENVEENRKKWLADEQRVLPLETATIDFVAPGEQQSEVDHAFEGEQTENGLFRDRRFRAIKSWLSYELKNDNKQARKLRVTYYGADKVNGLQIFVNDKLLQQVVLNGDKGEKFFDEEYLIPDDILSSVDAKSLKVRFVNQEATPTKIFFIRLLKNL
ncbi:glycoside hydrolase family 127 protein [Pedobacter glucosidilyticus]|uniref:glycoside hydrolase family 127 protein n=1 Tax=Pedobacter glucosidilyticus TaxID=1122941 RepID=UPI0026EA48BD|nr:glycoside hydrolase family 127 protein [Pedobacter glucosidilyticus]